LVRASPELILILLLYYAGTGLLNSLLTAYGYSSVHVSAFAAAVAVLAFVQGAYATEVLRAAVQAIPAGHRETSAHAVSKISISAAKASGSTTPRTLLSIFPLQH
jgi:polar amino acid transport system permease protein